MTRLWLLAGLCTGISDMIFATVLQLVWGRPVARLWQGVASVPFGPRAMEMGAAGVALGLLLHFCTAFAWSGVLLLLLQRAPRLRQLHPALLGATFGPCIWLVMSLAVIPLFTHNATTVTWRWWVQFAGHMLFVGQPMAWILLRMNSKT